ncbi:MAG: methylisocitrate lyase [Bdellovibrio sp. CG10_big_fil_rev_8_21_14_0_10_47_8]|nr:MAG: methylisocitrate lyase [Bdellovibrio sp. CG10_big_fil_rev_8_21_14_0_10_47_8]
MLFNDIQPTEKRKNFRAALQSGKLLKFPGAFSPLSAMQIEKLGFEGVYISGSVLSNDLGYPDVGLTTLTEVSQRGRQIARVTKLPSIIDADTGFGVALNAARTIQEFIELGLAGCHLEDQENPKRCGHLDGKALVSAGEMVQKIKAADQSRKLDPNFVIIARTDARASEGLDKAIDRAKAYIDAGADVIFTEALQDEKEFETFRKAVSAPLLANMTEFGKSKLLTISQLENLGFNIVIWPVTTLRLAMKAQEDGLKHILAQGNQEQILDKMQHRKELYELTNYERYNSFDQNIFNFKLK